MEDADELKRNAVTAGMSEEAMRAIWAAAQAEKEEEREPTGWDTHREVERHLQSQAAAAFASPKRRRKKSRLAAAASTTMKASSSQAGPSTLAGPKPEAVTTAPEDKGSPGEEEFETEARGYLADEGSPIRKAMRDPAFMESLRARGASERAEREKIDALLRHKQNEDGVLLKPDELNMNEVVDGYPNWTRLPLPRSMVECTSSGDRKNEGQTQAARGALRRTLRARTTAESSVHEVGQLVERAVHPA